MRFSGTHLNLFSNNVYMNKHLTNEEMVKKILCKDPERRNLFDIRYLLNHLASNNFFAKMKKEGNFDLALQCLKELKVLLLVSITI